ncbi:MAG: hypothetical protein QOJ80_2043 [Mycobacterium sp.]|nr:hypothetical protein [Mycobacterium sp.]
MSWIRRTLRRSDEPGAQLNASEEPLASPEVSTAAPEQPPVATNGAHILIPPVASANTVESPYVSNLTVAIRVVVGLTLSGVLVGLLWAWLAPSVQSVVALAKDGDRVRGYVGDEADHLFIAAFEMVGFLFVLAVVSAALVWKLRPHRGPLMVAALSLGLTAAAGVATGVGALLVHWRYGTVDVAGAPVTPEHRVHYVFEAPGVFFGHSPWQIATTILFPAGIAALVYAICALSARRDDLGAWPPVEQRYVGFTDPVPTAAGALPFDPSSPSR